MKTLTVYYKPEELITKVNGREEQGWPFMRIDF
jgi:hypothetical protein